MPNRIFLRCAVGLAVPVLALGCGGDSSRGEGSAGGAGPLASGGSGGRATTGSSGTTQAPVAGRKGTSGGATGIVIPNGGTGGGINGQILDGGEYPANQEIIDRINSEKCAGWEVEPEPIPVGIMLVMDNSSSMSRRAPGAPDDVTKWDVTRDSLLQAIPGVGGDPGLSAEMGIGLLFYPNKQTEINGTPAADVSRCLNTQALVPIQQLGPQGAPHRELVRNSIEEAVLIRSTPTHDAYKYALENGVLKSTLSGQRYMVLATDGTPTVSLNCVNPKPLDGVDPEPIVAEITRAAQLGIKTFLIGSPGSERNRPWMSRAAVIGGTALPGCVEAGPNWCHLDMTEAPDFSQALKAGLAHIVGSVTPCEYDTPTVEAGAKIDRALTNVTYTSPKINGGSPVLVVRDDVGECTKGWRLTADDRVELCPETCNVVRDDKSLVVKVSYGCEAEPKPPE